MNYQHSTEPISSLMQPFERIESLSIFCIPSELTSVYISQSRKTEPTQDLASTRATPSFAQYLFTSTVHDTHHNHVNRWQYRRDAILGMRRLQRFAPFLKSSEVASEPGGLNKTAAPTVQPPTPRTMPTAVPCQAGDAESQWW
jgi:hypothetical protein